MAKFVAGEGYGFIETADGSEVYFHRNSVLDDSDERLAQDWIEEASTKSARRCTSPIACTRRKHSLNDAHAPGGYVSSQWKITLNDAIGKIESGEQAFFVQAHRRTVGVIVAVGPSGKKYLKTEADGDQPDTLICPIF